MLAIAFVIVSVQYFRLLTESKNTAFENGVDEEEYDILRFGLWFYLVPQIVAFLFPIVFQYFYLALLLILFYVPSIYYGIKISQELDKGQDFVRKLSNQISQVAWIGLADIGLVILDWVFVYTNILLRGV